MDILDLLEKYSVTIGDTSYSPFLFLWVALFLFVIFTIKVIIYMKVDKRNRKSKGFWMLVGRQALCFLFAVVVSFSLTCIFGNNQNILLNYIICPVVGYLSHFLFNNKILGPMDKSYGVSKENESCNMLNSSQPEAMTKKFTISDFIKIPEKTDYISSTNMDSDECAVIVKDKINELIASRHVIAVEFNSINTELRAQTDILNAMRETMKDELKLKLEKLIYQCLDQGYTTPDQNKSITTLYHNYCSLGGNGEIQELYEKHYLKLDIRSAKKEQHKSTKSKS